MRGVSVEMSRSPSPSSRQSADGGGLLHEHRVGAAVDHPAVESIGADDAAESIGGLEDTTLTPRRCSS